jgi:glycosyltransferase involved in cell wall biosynthesis
MRKILTTFKLGHEQNIEFFDLGKNRNFIYRIWRVVYLVFRVKRVDILLLNSPSLTELLAAHLIKSTGHTKLELVILDLILQRPFTKLDSIKAKLKSILLSKVDKFLVFHKDLSGYTNYYKIPTNKFVYIPFKANNYGAVSNYEVQSGDYILSYGTSHRDYNTLISALAGLTFKTIIVAPTFLLKSNKASLDTESLTEYIKYEDNFINKEELYELISKAKFVVIPINTGVLQPAGISVYLECMAFGKAAIVSSGTSVDGIIDNGVAEIYESGSSKSLRSALLKLWNDDTYRKKLSEAGKKYADSLEGHDRLVDDIKKILINF